MVYEIKQKTVPPRALLGKEHFNIYKAGKRQSRSLYLSKETQEYNMCHTKGGTGGKYKRDG